MRPEDEIRVDLSKVLDFKLNQIKLTSSNPKVTLPGMNKIDQRVFKESEEFKFKKFGFWKNRIIGLDSDMEKVILFDIWQNRELSQRAIQEELQKKNMEFLDMGTFQ